MRDKLIEKIKDSLNKHIGKSCLLAENIADDLLQEGVVFQPCKTDAVEDDETIKISIYDTPFEIACKLLQARRSYTNVLNQKAEIECFDLVELRCIGEHLVNYCNTEEKFKDGVQG